MHRALVVAGLLAAAAVPAAAQPSWAPWHQPSLIPPPSRAPQAPQPSTSSFASLGGPSSAPAGLSLAPGAGPAGPLGPALLEGGPRPHISPMPPEEVRYASGHSPGTIVIDTRARRLYLVQSGSRALSYPVSVGREGFTWAGTERITRMADWPDWHPPAEMRERDPRLPVRMTGGMYNPLGAKALYLGNTLYRIHGTNDARTIGRAASSGCFRMHNAHVIDLARRVRVGTQVVVINAPTRTARSP